MYGLPETSDEVYSAFDRLSQGKHRKNDLSFLSSHIEKKKKSIREAKIRLDVEGRKTIAGPKEKTTLQQIMWHLDGGRR
jgi:hypothetical protein